MGKGFNGNKRVIDIPANGTLLAILATGPVRYIEVVESQVNHAGAANVPVGFQYKLPNDKFVQLFETIPGDTLQIGDRQAKYGPFGVLLGNGPDTPGAGTPPIVATTVFEAQSVAAATSIEVTEWF